MELIKDTIDLSDYMDVDTDAHLVRKASDWLDDVIDHFHNPDPTAKGPTLPWRKTQQDFNFRRGEVTIWAGINGHGKSQLLGQVVLGLMEQYEKVCLASFEMKPYRTMARMSRQAYAGDEPGINYLKSFHQWTDGRLWIYDKLGNAKPNVLMAVIRYAVDKFGIDHFVIDNLTKVVAGEDDYSAQKDFVNAITSIAADLNIHIHIVMHVRKGKDEDDVPNKMSIKGAGSVTDMVDNVFIVWRNKKKERKMRENDGPIPTEPDAILALDKQRNGETEGSYQLWFDGPSFQYLEDRHAQPKPARLAGTITAPQIDTEF